MTDERIQRARRAETQALIDQHATDREQMELLAASGVTILGLAAALGGPCPVKGMPPSRPPDPEAVAKVRARIRRRRRLGLPDVDCLDRKCKCGALLDALDQTDESAPKDEVVRAARKLHKRRAGPFRTLPQFRHLLPRPRVEPDPPAARERPQMPPAPIPAAVVTQTSTKPFRRRKRWWDGPDGGQSIRDMKF
jgi:hypothetical protein